MRAFQNIDCHQAAADSAKNVSNHEKFRTKIKKFCNGKKKKQASTKSYFDWIREHNRLERERDRLESLIEKKIGQVNNLLLDYNGNQNIKEAPKSACWSCDSIKMNTFCHDELKTLSTLSHEKLVPHSGFQSLKLEPNQMPDPRIAAITEKLSSLKELFKRFKETVSNQNSGNKDEELLETLINKHKNMIPQKQPNTSNLDELPYSRSMLILSHLGSHNGNKSSAYAPYFQATKPNDSHKCNVPCVVHPSRHVTAIIEVLLQFGELVLETNEQLENETINLSKKIRCLHDNVFKRDITDENEEQNYQQTSLLPSTKKWDVIIPKEIKVVLENLSTHLCIDIDPNNSAGVRNDQSEILCFNELQESITKSFNELHETFERKTREARVKFIRACPKHLTNSCDGVWKDSHQQLFLKIVKQHDQTSESISSTLKKTKIITDHFINELPNHEKNDISIAEIKDHLIWWEQSQIKKRKEKSYLRELQYERNNLLEKSFDKIDDFRDCIFRKRHADVTSDLLRLRKSENHAKLHMLQETRNEATRCKIDEHERSQRKIKEKEAKRELIAQHHHEETRKKLQDYSKKQNEKNKMENAKENRKIIAEKQKKEIQLRQNLKRYFWNETESSNSIHYLPLSNFVKSPFFFNDKRLAIREKLIEEKEQIKKQSILAAKIEKEKQFKRLSILANSVPYNDRIKNMKPNIHKITACRKNDIFDAGSSKRMFEFQRNIPYSFSTERLFSDKAFRLGHELHEAGVAQTTYARELVNKIIPRFPERTTGIEPF